MSLNNPEHRAGEPATYVANPEYAEAEAYQVKNRVEQIHQIEEIESRGSGLMSNTRPERLRRQHGMDKQLVYNPQKAEEMAYAEQGAHDEVAQLRLEIEQLKELIAEKESYILGAQARAGAASDHQAELYDKNLTEEVKEEVLPTDDYNPSGSITTTTLTDRTTGEVVSSKTVEYDPRNG